jgi:ornithine carbamoyltransferase
MRRYTQTDTELVVRACLPIKQGEEITTQYRNAPKRRILP